MHPSASDPIASMFDDLIVDLVMQSRLEGMTVRQTRHGVEVTTIDGVEADDEDRALVAACLENLTQAPRWQPARSTSVVADDAVMADLNALAVADSAAGWVVSFWSDEVFMEPPTENGARAAMVFDGTRPVRIEYQTDGQPARAVAPPVDNRAVIDAFVTFPRAAAQAAHAIAEALVGRVEFFESGEAPQIAPGPFRI